MTRWQVNFDSDISSKDSARQIERQIMPGQDDRKIKRFVNSKIDRKVDKVDDRKIVTEIDEEDTWIERQIERQIWIDRWMCGQIDDMIEVDIEIERKLQINRWIDLQKDRQISRQIELNVCQWIDMKGWNRQIKFAIGQLVQGVQEKLCFSQLTATTPWPALL